MNKKTSNTGVSKRLLQYAADNRAGMTTAEDRLRHFLTQDFPGRFVSQHVIKTDTAEYIVDFCSKRDNLIIEVDGESHRGKKSYDSSRQAALEAKGYRVLRFKNEDVIGRVGYVLNVIRKIP